MMPFRTINGTNHIYILIDYFKSRELGVRLKNSHRHKLCQRLLVPSNSSREPIRTLSASRQCLIDIL